ncbi:MAG: ribonuclease R [Bacteroidales bacterium]|nr:ribonuclease R [Bacteroidales bacterium]
MTKKQPKKNKTKNIKDNLEKIEQEPLLANILAIFKQSVDESFNYKQISAQLGYTNLEDRQKVAKGLEKLCRLGALIRVGRGKYQLAPQIIEKEAPPSVLIGKLDFKSTGKAYFINPDLNEDIFIAAPNTGQALPGDKVKIRLLPKRKNRKPEGIVIEVLERNRNQFVGVFEKGEYAGYVIPDDPRMPVEFVIPKELINGATEGDKVVVELVEWEKGIRSPVGKIIRVLGQPGENEVEMLSILVNNGFHLDFPEDVLQESLDISKEIKEADIKYRKDFRDVLTFTIDPAEAKDFDDAISFKKLDNDTYEIGIHIADVTHYVKPQSKIDKEAYQRATSVYLVDRTLHMLPERLSADVCSLKPGEDRLAFSVILKMNSKAKVLSSDFYETVINSDYRFNYEEVQQIIEGKRDDVNHDALRTLNDLAQILRADRFRRGAINFHSEEINFILNEQKKPIDIVTKEQKEANQLIEELMLLANKTVAEYIGLILKQKFNRELPFVYRVHDKPSAEKIANFAVFLRKLGYKLNLENEVALAKSMNHLFEQVADRPEENMINQIAIRTMSRAIYTTHNIGHYGLAFKYYTHFTSPIRRYPDIMVHRLLKSYLAKNNKIRYEKISELEEKCKHASEMEEKAQNAEWDSIKYKQAEFMLDKVGKVFTGYITGVSKWGLFVELDGKKCEGLVHMVDMKDDYYYLDENNYMLVGHRTGIKYKLGDRVRVKIKYVDVAKKQIGMTLC